MQNHLTTRLNTIKKNLPSQIFLNHLIINVSVASAENFKSASKNSILLYNLSNF